MHHCIGPCINDETGNRGRGESENLSPFPRFSDSPILYSIPRSPKASSYASSSPQGILQRNSARTPLAEISLSSLHPARSSLHSSDWHMPQMPLAAMPIHPSPYKMLSADKPCLWVHCCLYTLKR